MAVMDEVVIRLRAIGGAAAAGEVKGAEGAVAGLGRASKVAGAAITAGVVYGLVKSVEAAVKFQDVTASLHNALQNMGQDTAANNKQIIAAAEEMSTHGGLSATENVQGMQEYIRANVGVTEAIKDQQLATDISLAKNKSMATVTRALLMVEQGRLTGLGRMGIVIKPVTAAQDALTAAHVKATLAQKHLAKEQDAQATKMLALRTLWATYGGEMKKHSDSAAGAASNLKHQFENLKVHLGTVLLPVVTKFLLALSKVVEFFEKNKTAAIVLGTVLGALAAAWVAVQVAAAEAFIEENLALVGIPALIAAASVGIVLLITHWKEVVKWLKEARHWLIDHQWVLAIMMLLGPLSEVVAITAFLAIHFKEVKAVVVAVFHAAKAEVMFFVGYFRTAFTVVKTVALAVFGAIKSVVVTVFNVIRPIAVGTFKAIQGIAMIVFTVLRVGFTVVKKVAQLAFEGIAWVVRNVLAPVFNSVAMPAINAVKDVFVHLWNDVLKPLGSFLGGVFTTVWGALKDIWSTIKGIVQGLADAFGKVLSVFKDIGNWVASTGPSVIDFVNALNPNVQDVGPGNKNIPGLGKGVNTSPMNAGNHAYGVRWNRRAGWATVGEHGTERVFLPGGARVDPTQGAGGFDGTPAGHPLEATFQIGTRELMKATGYAQAKLKATS